MTCIDDCYDCHWRVTAGAKPLWTKYSGQSGSYVDEWCGAGRVEFNTDDGRPTCPMRLEIFELEINDMDQPEAFDDSGQISSECMQWIQDNIPNTRIKLQENEIQTDTGWWLQIREAVLRFEYLNDIILFKMKWF